MIKARGIRKTYHTGDVETTVLHDIDLDIKEGEFVAIMGPSGAGKSTLLYQLSLLDKPTAGEVEINNFKTSNLTLKERTRFRLTHFGFVFQDYALIPDLNALENVYVTLLMQGKGKVEIENRARALLEDVGLGERLGNLPSQLSGGEQQRVSVARAIAHNPGIVFADEPTASLDSERSHEIMKIFDRLNNDGQTIVMITHEEEYARYAKRIIEIKDGAIISDEVNRK